jgi:hypothetical protein
VGVEHSTTQFIISGITTLHEWQHTIAGAVTEWMTPNQQYQGFDVLMT